MAWSLSDVQAIPVSQANAPLLHVGASLSGVGLAIVVYFSNHTTGIVPCQKRPKIDSRILMFYASYFL
jgi:hypothetical protein